MINISDITTAELQKSEELDLIADSEGYLKKLSEHEEDNVYGGRWVNKPDTACWKDPQVWVD